MYTNIYIYRQCEIGQPNDGLPVRGSKGFDVFSKIYNCILEDEDEDELLTVLALINDVSAVRPSSG